MLGDIFTVLLAPYDDKGAFAGRIRISLPRMGVGENAATALAMVVHELARLGGSISYEWAKSGALVTLQLNCKLLAV